MGSDPIPPGTTTNPLKVLSYWIPPPPPIAAISCVSCGENAWYVTDPFRQRNPWLLPKTYIGLSKTIVLGQRPSGGARVFAARPGQTSVLPPPPVRLTIDILMVTTMALVWTITNGRLR